MNTRHSLIANKPPSYLNKTIKNAYSWLDAKREDDNIDNLWRVHDDIYDLTDFVDIHPGGSEWLKLTKGTDVTEAFEVHHLNASKAENTLKKYWLRKATTPRNIKLTFKEDGFYKILKKRVAEKLPSINTKPILLSKIYIDACLLLTFCVSILALKYRSLPLALFGGFLLTSTVVAAHNYFHTRDNYRMFYFNLSFMSFHEWRVSHALSHHLFPNSLQDMEVLFFEPFLSWLPNPNLKNVITRYASWIYGPIFWTLLFVSEFLKRLPSLIMLKTNLLHKDDLIPFTLPLVMYLFGDSDIISTFKWWLIILLVASFYFGLIGFNAGHHHPEVVHDGDAVRDDLDWGLFTLDTVIDREDLKGSQLLILSHFGNHALHHLFPTLDHGILHELYPILYQTMEEHSGELKSYSWFPLIIGQHQQLARIEPLRDCPLKRGIYGNKMK